MKQSLGLPDDLENVQFAAGSGGLRALSFDISGSSEFRSVLSSVAARLASRAPQYLWLMCAAQPALDTIGIAVFTHERSKPRVAALVTVRSDVVDSDAETVCAMTAVANGSDAFQHSRWADILGRESISRRFFRELERLVGALASTVSISGKGSPFELALLYVSRLLFLSFLETKGWLNGDRAFLTNQFADCMLHGGGYHDKVLKPLFFGTLNTRPAKRSLRARRFGQVPFLNGGLFARSALEARASHATFPDDALGDLFGDLLTRYRFTAREDGSSWTEAAVDPEMLGKAFETLMSSQLRKTSGAYYTPNSLVRDVTRSALSHCAAVSGADIRILDPACGSGAFLVHAVEEIASLKNHGGDERPVHVIRREVLTRSIFGVDINPTAVWLCELRLWLSMTIEDPETNPMRVVALPNLDRNIRVGDSLAGGAFDGTPVIESRRIASVRSRYTRASGPRKRSLGGALDSLERKCAIDHALARKTALAYERREILIALRSRDLFGSRSLVSREMKARVAELKSELRELSTAITGLRDGSALPFSFATHFADAAASKGFDVVIGNPPWIRSHNIDRMSREALRDRFRVYRAGGWSAGATAAGAGKGFGSQVDAAALFVEQSLALVRDGGVMSLIVPSKLWRSLAGAGVRQLVLEKTELLELHDLTHAPQQFDASVYPSVVVARRSADTAMGCVSIHHSSRSGARAFPISRDRLPFDSTEGSPWITAPSHVRHAFDLLRNSGTPLASSAFGRPLLGVKTGCNDAFIMSHDDACREGIEKELIRPLIRGDSINRGSVSRSAEVIVFPHQDGRPMSSLPPAAHRWFAKWRGHLETRTDLRPRDPWWRLFRSESADCSMARVVWADIGLSPRAAILEKGDPTVPLNSCYAVAAPSRADADALVVLLSSRVADAWLGLTAEPVRGGYRRYFGWTMAMYPLPCDWPRARRILAPLINRLDDPDELTSAVVTAYGLDCASVSPLLEWEQ
jgi:hypothetical protein